MKFKSFLNQLSNRRNGPAISILLPTHRTFPDNKQDAITLKNLVREAEERLYTELDKREAKAIIDTINQAVEKLDHNYNLDGLGIFADRDGVIPLRFPFSVKERVIIDETFVVRDFVREINDAVHCHILVISRTAARLIETFNDRLIHEFDSQTELRTGSFPMENPFQFAPEGLDRAQIPSDAGNLKEFFNRVDKSLQEIQNKPERERLPVFIVGDARNVAFFKEVCDQPTDIVGEMTTVIDSKVPAEKIIVEIQGILDAYRGQRAETALQHITQARNAHQLLTDFSTVFRAITAGNAARLFVRQGYIQPGIIDFEQRTVTLHDDPAAPGVTDDVVDTFIELVIRQGGEICFLSAAQLENEKPLSLQTRY